jgi:hypothetical protein
VILGDDRESTVLVGCVIEPVTTKAWPAAASVTRPPAVQSPTEVHDTDSTMPPAPVLRLPAISRAASQVPPRSVTTKASKKVLPTPYSPPAAQLPALGQEIVSTLVSPEMLSAPATWRAADHTPCRSLTTKACCPCAVEV